MPWWGWILVGVVLLGSELFITTEFFLVFFGTAALAMGVYLLMGFEPAIWAQWLSFAGLSAILMVSFRRRIWDKIGRGGAPVGDRVVGEVATATDRIEPGAQGRAELRGTVWTVRNVGDQPIAAGERVHVEELDGLVALVRKEE